MNIVLQKQIFSILERADNQNSQNSMKRFWPMTQFKNGKLIEYGVYDYKTKKYLLFTTYSLNIEDEIKQLETFIG
jgi:hypothetical protein